MQLNEAGYLQNSRAPWAGRLYVIRQYPTCEQSVHSQCVCLGPACAEIK